MTIVLCFSLALSACTTSAPKPDPTAVEGTASTSEPKYRTVDRSTSTKDQAPELPFDPFDPYVAAAVPTGDRDRVAAEFGVKLDETTPAFVGDFATESGDELAMVSAAGELAVVSTGGEVRARRAIGLLDPETPPRAARLVDDRLDLVVVRRESAEAPRTLSVYRVIGEALAEVFTANLDEFTVEFVHRGEERAIHLVGPERTDLYRWNRWEGMFRIPRPAPTAPPRS